MSFTVHGAPALRAAPVVGVSGEQMPVTGSQALRFWHTPAGRLTPAQQSALQTPLADVVSPAQHGAAMVAVLPAVVQQVPSA